MKKTLPIFITMILFAQWSIAQSFTNWVTGDAEDFITNQYQKGMVLAGGGTDNDDAMKWMLERAGGGDVVIIRASGSDGYNPYFYSELGVSVNSVETIRFDAADAANDPYVIEQIRSAELLFIAGGDQFVYYEYWKDTPIEDAINYLINEKEITVGGTSAGMAILGGAYYTPSAGSLDAEEGLSNPFHPDADIIGNGDFVNAPFLENMITDTHYDNRDRAGRHLVFLARLSALTNTSVRGIACNEVTVVCVDENGVAHIFGEHPDYPDYAYFLETKCPDEILPEIMVANTPLTWNKEGKAVTVYKVPGKVNGANTFDLTDWETGTGGAWEYWYAEEGTFFQVPVDGEICETVNNTLDLGTANISIYPNPFSKSITLTAESTLNLTIFNQLGYLVYEQEMTVNNTTLPLDFLSKGVYYLHIQQGGATAVKKITKM